MEYGIEKVTDKLDKFKDHLLQVRELTADRDIEYFEKMSFAWGLACRMQSPQQIITSLNAKYGHQKSQAYNILADTFRLYGDAYEIHKSGIRNILIEAGHKALSLAMMNRDAEIILKCIDSLRKLYEFDKMDSSLIPPPEARMPGGTRVYTTGPVQINNLIQENGTTNS